MESIATIRAGLYIAGIVLLLLLGGFFIYLIRFWRDDNNPD
jgi:hypothetical protein